MLEILKISNVALIKDIEINFSKGFNVILGETGAGKSIIIDALNFVLGDKADKTMIRAYEETMKVTAKFTTANKKVFQVLNNLGIEYDSGEILLSRTYNQSGKNDARINGEVITINILKEIGNILVDAYSQHESVSLLKQKNHLSILDSYKPFEIKELKKEIEWKIQELNSINSEIKNLGGSKENRERQIDILRYQINEIEDARLEKKEDEEINDKLEKMSHSEKIVSALNRVNEILNGEENSILDLLKSSNKILSNIEHYDDKIAQLNQILNNLNIDLEDISESLLSLNEEYNFDENALEKLIIRRDKIVSLKKKYGNGIDLINKFLDNAKIELERLENTEEILSRKENEKKKLLDETLELMKKLSEIRRKNSIEIEQKVITGLVELGMVKAKFKVNFFPLTDSIYNLEHYSINCLEDAEFLFSANYGEELKPLAKTISGGELNRFMLVFKNIIAEIDGSETLIFDEIDSGTSGKIANSVALRIAKISKKYQILCITHLPQVASMGDSFYYVYKTQINNRTETNIKELKDERVVEELALLSYGKIDVNSINFVKSMLEQNKQIKSNME